MGLVERPLVLPCLGFSNRSQHCYDRQQRQQQLPGQVSQVAEAPKRNGVIHTEKWKGAHGHGQLLNILRNGR